MISRLRVISLDRTPERFATFLRTNPHIPVERFAAIDGLTIDRAACVRDNLITADNTYRPGAIGHTLSNITLWRQCAAGSEPFHIAEDDAILRADFADAAANALAGLGAWDVVLWTHNFDWPVMLRPPGVGSIILQCDPEDATRRPGEFQWSITQAVLLPLVSAAGNACYSVSPAGAANLLAACLPVGAAPAVYVANPERSWLNSGLDVEMSRHYGDLRAYIAVPPLAVVTNNQTASTIRGHLAAIHDPAAANRAPSA